MYKIKATKANVLSKYVNGMLIGENRIIEYISTDTREGFNKNTCFIAIKGDSFDGNSFIDGANANNYSLIITDKKISFPVPTIIVDDTKKAIGLLAKYFSKKINKIGITGSVGKTTVKEMITLVLKEKHCVSSTNKNENNEIGVAKTLLSANANEYCIVEMGMRAFGEIDWLSYIVEPNISIITNCGTSHLGLLGSEENIFKAKLEILKNTKKYVLVPYEKRFVYYNYGKIKPIFIGGREIYYFDLCYNNNGMKFSVKYMDSVIKDINISSFNINNATNALFAIAIGKLCNISDEQIKSGLNKYKGENMHEEILNINGITIIEDCYNASYESVKGAIFSLKRYAEIKGLSPNLLLGDMLEMGNASKEYHYRIGELAKDLGIKHLFAIGKYSKDIADGFSGGTICNEGDSVASLIMSKLNKNDVILVKASRALKLEKIVEQMKEIEK